MHAATVGKFTLPVDFDTGVRLLNRGQGYAAQPRLIGLQQGGAGCESK